MHTFTKNSQTQLSNILSQRVIMHRQRHIIISSAFDMPSTSDNSFRSPTPSASSKASKSTKSTKSTKSSKSTKSTKSTKSINNLHDTHSFFSPHALTRTRGTIVEWRFGLMGGGQCGCKATNDDSSHDRPDIGRTTPTTTKPIGSPFPAAYSPKKSPETNPASASKYSKSPAFERIRIADQEVNDSPSSSSIILDGDSGFTRDDEIQESQFHSSTSISRSLKLSIEDEANTPLRSTKARISHHSPKIINGGGAAKEYPIGTNESEHKLADMLNESPGEASAFDRRELEVKELSEIVMQKIEMMRDEYLDSPHIQECFRSYVPLLCTHYPGSEHLHDVNERLHTFLGEPNPASMVIFGDTGSGKTTLAVTITRYLWKTWTPNDPIPILIPATGLSTPLVNAIEERLHSPAFLPAPANLFHGHPPQATSYSSLEIEFLKDNFSFVFIFDDADQIAKQNESIYVGNRLSTWDAKSIFLCNISLARSCSDYITFFSQPSSESNPAIIANEMVLAPLTVTQVEIFVEKYTESRTKRESPSSKLYIDTLSKSATLQQLITNPLLLTIVLEILPHICDLHHPNIASERLRHLTVYEIIGLFLEHEIRSLLRRIHNDPDLSKSRSVLAISFEDIHEYYKAFAYRLESKSAINAYHHPRNKNVYDPRNEWESFFNFQSKVALTLRQTRILTAFTRHHFGFSSSLFRSYFVSLVEKNILLDNPPELWVQKYFHHEFIQSNVDSMLFKTLKDRVPILAQKKRSQLETIIDNLAAQAAQNEMLEKRLWQLVNNSKTDKAQSSVLLASNCISVLNRAGLSFSTKDLSGISIEGADLSNSNLEETKLCDANLREVSFIKAFIKNTDFSNSDLHGATFVPFPQIHHPYKVCRLLATGKPAHIVYVIGGNVVSAHHQNSLEISCRISLPANEVAEDAMLYSSLDDNRLVVLAKSGSLFVYNPISLDLLNSIDSRGSNVRKIVRKSTSHQNDGLIYGLLDKAVLRIWNTDNLPTYHDIELAVADACDVSVVRIKSGEEVLLVLQKSKFMSVLKRDNGRKIIDVVLSSIPTCLSTFVLSDNETLISIGGLDGSVSLYSSDGWVLKKRFTSKRGSITNVEFLLQGDQASSIAVSHSDHSITILDALEMEAKSSFCNNQSPISSILELRIDRDHFLVTGGLDGCVAYTSLNPYLTTKMKVKSDSKVTSVCGLYDRGGFYLAIATLDGSISITNTMSGKPAVKLQGHTSGPHILESVVTGQGQVLLLSVSSDCSIRLWSLESLCEVWINRKYEDVQCACLCPETRTGQVIAIGLADGSIRMISIDTGKEMVRLNGQSGGITSLCYLQNTPMGILCAACENYSIELWDVETCRIVATLSGHCGVVKTLLPFTTRDGRHLILSASEDQTMCFWDCQYARCVQTIELAGGHIHGASILIQPDGRQSLVTCNSGSMISMWDLDGRRHTSDFLVHDPCILRPVSSPKGDYFYCVSIHGQVSAWRIEYRADGNRIKLDWRDEATLVVENVCMEGVVGLRGVEQNILIPQTSRAGDRRDLVDIRSFQHALRSAEDGDVVAQYKTGMCYKTGKGVDPSADSAILWLHRASANGHHGASVQLGICFEEGFGVPVSLKDAAKYYETAAENNNRVGKYRLGRMLLSGRGVPQNTKKALEYLISAGDAGISDAQILLGRFYGVGVDGEGNSRQTHIDVEKSLLWLERAANGGDARGWLEIGGLLINSDRERDLKRAAESYKKAADYGIAAAQYHYAMCLLSGRGVDKMEVDAIPYLRAAAQSGYADAQVNLGGCFESGNGVSVCLEEAVRWYSMAAEQNDLDACVNLGNCYFHGRGIEQNFSLAAKWYKIAAESGDCEAMHQLGLCHQLRGDGNPESIEQAKLWFQKGAAQNHYNSLVSLDNISTGNVSPSRSDGRRLE